MVNLCREQKLWWKLPIAKVYDPISLPQCIHNFLLNEISHRVCPFPKHDLNGKNRKLLINISICFLFFGYKYYQQILPYVSPFTPSQSFLYILSHKEKKKKKSKTEGLALGALLCPTPFVKHRNSNSTIDLSLCFILKTGQRNLKNSLSLSLSNKACQLCTRASQRSESAAARTSPASPWSCRAERTGASPSGSQKARRRLRSSSGLLPTSTASSSTGLASHSPSWSPTSIRDPNRGEKKSFHGHEVCVCP